MSCGPDREYLRLLIEDLLREAIADGRVQGGLKNCAGDKLDANTKTPDCAALDAEVTAREAAVEKEATARENAVRELQTQRDTDVAAQQVKDQAQDEAHAALKLVVDKAVEDIAAWEDENKFPTSASVLEDGALRFTMNDGSHIDVKTPNVYTESGKLDGNKLVFTRNDDTKYEVDLCGWKGVQPCEYYATLQVTMASNECNKGNGMFRRVAYLYHPDDLRDPAADVQFTDCDDNTIGWLYSTKTPQHNVEMMDGAGKTLGYAMPTPTMRVWGEGCNGCAQPDAPPAVINHV